MTEKYNRGFEVDEMVAELPAGLERSVLRTLGYHTGRESAISRGRLQAAVRSLGFDVDERAVRLAINQLRKQGVPICATGGFRGGYWMARDWDELQEFLDREHKARIADLSEQIKALTRAAEERWGPPKPEQFKLF